MPLQPNQIEEYDETQAIIDGHKAWMEETALNQEYQDLQIVKGWLIRKMNSRDTAIEEDHDHYIWAKTFKKECDKRQDAIRKLLKD